MNNAKGSASLNNIFKQHVLNLSTYDRMLTHRAVCITINF